MDLQEIEKKLQALEDAEQVKHVMYRYVNGLMFADWEEVMSCFTDTTWLDVFVEKPKIQGKEIIEKTFREVVSVKHSGNEGDIATHPIVTVDGDKAKGKWIIYFFDAEMDKEKWRAPGWVKGIYNAEFIKENGEWKFSYLHWRPCLPSGMTMPPGGPE